MNSHILSKYSFDCEKYPSVHLEDDREAAVEGEVKKSGNGAMMFSKKYIGRKVYVLIRK